MFLGLIESLAELHGQLTASSNIDEIEIGGFLSNLCATLGAFASEGDSICRVHTETESVIVDSATAIPLGIIANEFITNSLKCAMSDNECVIRLTVARSDPEVSVDALIALIGAEGAWSDNDGTQLHIRIPRAKKKVATAH